MNLNEPFFVKSLEEDLATKRLDHGQKKPFQSIEEMVIPENGLHQSIKPNTVSFGQADRLSCTVLNPNYTKTYRPQGIIFQTDVKPDYIAPFDLMVLANVPGEVIKADYYSIVDELKEHYGRSLISGYNQFLFRTPEEMFRTIPNPEVAWEKVNEYRKSHGLTPILETEKKLVFYNEAVFHKTIDINPVAIFGDPETVPDLVRRAEKLGLPTYISASDFYEKIQELKRESIREQNIKIK